MSGPTGILLEEVSASLVTLKTPVDSSAAVCPGGLWAHSLHLLAWEHWPFSQHPLSSSWQGLTSETPRPSSLPFPLKEIPMEDGYSTPCVLPSLIPWKPRGGRERTVNSLPIAETRNNNWQIKEKISTLCTEQPTLIYTTRPLSTKTACEHKLIIYPNLTTWNGLLLFSLRLMLKPSNHSPSSDHPHSLLGPA